MKPERLILFAVIAVTSGLAGCAANSVDSDTAWDRYLQFESALDHQGMELDFKPYFTEHAYADVAEASAEDLPYVKGMLAYPLYFDETYGHAEKGDVERRCLTVNGQTPRGDIGSLSIEFVQQNGLKMNDANMLFVDSLDELPGEARCPEETRF